LIQEERTSTLSKIRPFVLDWEEILDAWEGGRSAHGVEKVEKSVATSRSDVMRSVSSVLSGRYVIVQ
jgi:hypothetical protein